MITALTTSIFKFLEYWKNRKGQGWEARLESKMKPLVDMQLTLCDKVDHNEGELREIRLDTTRLQLLILMEHQPDNIDTILSVAEYYFVKLKGDLYMTVLFNKWAKEHKVDIPTNIYDSIKNHQ